MSGKADMLDWIDARTDKMVEQVKTWSRVNSGSYNLKGLEAMAEIAVPAFEVLEADHECHEVEPMEAVNDAGEPVSIPLGPVHIFRKRPEADRRVLLTGHLDTVFPKDHSFQDVMQPDDNILNGPGVADMKGGIIVMITALQALERYDNAEKIGWDVLLNSDEEIGSPGSAPYLSEYAAKADFGMTYEPALSDGTLAGQRKGSGNFTIVVKGKAAHAGREFDAGRNAVVHLARLIDRLHELNGEREGVTVNLAIIRGGEATNVVPDTAICRLNIRIERPEDTDWASAELLKLVREADREEGFSARLYGGFTRPPKILTPENEALFRELKRCGKELDIEIAWKATGGCCDGNNLAAAGLPNIDTLGVRGGDIHSSAEFVCLDSFAERAKLSALMLMRYADGDFDLKDKKD